MCGLKGEQGNLSINPQLPKEWDYLNVKREFKGACFNVIIKRADVQEVTAYKNEKLIESNLITNIVSGTSYTINVDIPK